MQTALLWATARCAQQECCAQDLSTKLIEGGLSPTELDQVLIYLEDNNYLSEERFARAFVHDKFTFGAWGRRKIVQALRSKKISEAQITKALLQIDETEYEKSLLALLLRKKRTLRFDATDWKACQQAKQKILRFALSRGFETDLIFRLLPSLLPEMGDD